MRKKLPVEYNDVQFVTTSTLLGLAINLQNNSTRAASTRLNKAKAAWGVVKQRIFLGKQIKNKAEIDLWNAAIGSIMKYGLTTPRIGETLGKLHQFRSKCIYQIPHANEPQRHNGVSPIDEHQRRQTNYENRRQLRIPTVHSQLRAEKYAIYRWRTTLSPAYPQ